MDLTNALVNLGCKNYSPAEFVRFALKLDAFEPLVLVTNGQASRIVPTDHLRVAGAVPDGFSLAGPLL